jgi:hypothetical protein
MFLLTDCVSLERLDLEQIVAEVNLSHSGSTVFRG